VSLLVYEWRDHTPIPFAVRIVEREAIVPLPDRALISFGRSAESGVRANDIVLTHPDEQKSQAISRWHFVLRRDPGGLVLRNDSRDVEVDGVQVATGAEAPVHIGSVVRVASVLTLEFLAAPASPVGSPVEEVTLILK